MQEFVENLKLDIPPVYVHLAEQLNFTKDKELLFFYYLLVNQRQKGSIALNLDTKKLSFIYPSPFWENFSLKSFLQKLAQCEQIEEITSLPAFPKKPIILLSLKNEKFLYFNREFTQAQSIGEKLWFLKQQKAVKDLSRTIKNLQNFFRKKNQENILSPEQFLALANTIAFPFSIISGGPGTGKTTIVRYLLEYLTEEEKITAHEIKIAAPTGRAAQRIKEAMKTVLADLECQTIHRLLGFSQEKFAYNSQNKLFAKYIIIDEVSMIDISLLDALLSAIREGTHLVFLGDPNQLPPVGSGAILSDLAPDVSECTYVREEKLLFEKLIPNLEMPWGQKEVSRVIFLMRNYREAKENQKLTYSISQIANCLLKKEETELKKFLENPKDSLSLLENGCHFVKINRFSLLDKIQSFFKPVYQKASQLNLTTKDSSHLKEEIEAILLSKRILTFNREYHNGSRAINEVLDSYFGKGEKYYPGKQVLITKNDPRTGLFNGDIGIVLNVGEKYEVFFIKNQELISLSPLLLPEHESAWAITVHKAQGSEFSEVVLILPDDPQNQLNNRQMLYTAITRAKKKVLIIGQEDVFLTAAKNIAYRENGYPFWDKSFSKISSVS